MTATTSTTKSFFGKRFLNDISQNKKMLIINSILALLGLPVISAIVLILMEFESKRNTNNMKYADFEMLVLPFLFIAVGTLMISIALGLIIPLFHFDYLYRKPIVDMHYSLPLSSTQRFFADYLSGLCIYMIPTIIAAVLALVTLLIGGMFIDLQEIGDAIPSLIKSGFIVLVGMIFMYTLSVFAIVFCGSTFEAIFSIIALNVMIPSTICCVWLAVIHNATYGLVDESIITNPLLTSTSPIGITIFFITYLTDGIEESLNDIETAYYSSLYLRWMLVTAVVCVLILACTYLLYRFRKAESVSKPYVYKAYFYALSTMSVFCIVSLMISTDLNIIAASVASIIICGIGWFIMEVIARRGFKRFWTAPLGFIGAVLGVFLICGVCYATDGFGASLYVPSVLTIDSVSVSVSDDTLLEYGSSNIQYRDKNVIKAVTALQKEAVDRHYNYDKYSYTSLSNNNNDRLEYTYDTTTFEITYQTIYGNSICRSYQVPSYMATDVLTAIVTSNEYANFISNELGMDIFNHNEQNNNVYYRSYSDALRKAKGGRLYLYNKLLNSNPNSVYLENESVTALHDAYLADMKALTPEQLASSDIYCYLENEYWVLDCFSNTRAFLENYSNITIPEIDADSLENSNISINTDIVFYYQPEIIFEKDNQKTRYYDYYYDYNESPYIKAEAETITILYPGHHYGNYGTNNTRYNDALVKLANNSTSIVINQKVLACITNQNTSFYIPDTPENRQLLKQYYKT